ncbi:ExeA family protein [Dongia sp.]|uniref:ExeA family protein n=1 Tax=Dongia sp. TaxID=1977262 RepID=UPI0037520ECC
MYEAFFNLKNKPFSLLPDPEFLFLSSRHAVGLSLLEYSLTGQAGFCVITGEIGSGKTTLVRAFLGRVGRDFTVGLISNTHHALKDIAAWAMTSFGQKPSGTHPAETYQELMEYLIAEYGAGRQCILIVDEAQNLSIEVLEELRLLSNINSGKDLLLQVVLVGQPELLEKLRRPELSQFAQRIAVSHHLTPLPYAETRRYIEHRVKVAGSDRPLFTEMAMGAIQYFSGGIPRLINSICDMALVYGFADETPVIGEDLVFRVVSDRQLSGIAPFAQAVPADDPTVRAEIMKLANLGAAASEAPPPAKPAAPRAEPPAPGPARETPDFVATIPEQPGPFTGAPERRQGGKVAPIVAHQIPLDDAVIQQVLVKETPLRGTHIQERPARETPFVGEASMREVPAREAPLRAAPRANPYFFREVEDDEELLLTREMNDSSRNAHDHVVPAPRATSHVSSPDREEPYLEAPRSISPTPLRAELAPNQSQRMEEGSNSVVDPMPWPSINERRLGAPIPAKEHGTGTLPRRSWWRRSIGHNS